MVTSTDPEIRYLAKHYDWVIVPILNVDGYEYTHTTVSYNWEVIPKEKNVELNYFLKNRIVYGERHENRIRLRNIALVAMEIATSIFFMQVIVDIPP